MAQTIQAIVMAATELQAYGACLCWQGTQLRSLCC